MFKRTKTQALKDNAASASELATALAKDRKFRKQLVSALGRGVLARRRAKRRIGFTAAVARLSGDPKLRRELRSMVKNLDKAWTRVEKKRSHRLRNTVLALVGAGGAAAAALPARKWLSGRGGGTHPVSAKAVLQRLRARHLARDG